MDGPTGPAQAATAELSAAELAAVRDLLRAHVPGVGPLRASLIAGGKSNLTYALTDGTHEWVLRRPPLGHVLATAHDMGREYRVHLRAAPPPRCRCPRTRCCAAPTRTCSARRSTSWSGSTASSTGPAADRTPLDADGARRGSAMA